MVTESTSRLLNPVTITFDQAIVVAVIGLIVNGVSAWLLMATPHEHHRHDHDHNLKATYLHVMADALTSFLAIAALLAGKYWGGQTGSIRQWVFLLPMQSNIVHTTIEVHQCTSHRQKKQE